MSTTDHGPTNHDDDLSRALRGLVDDASLPGLDAHLDVVRGRTRRRRAAKKVALGATTLCVAGALGVAAITLPEGVRTEPVPPAESTSPSPTPSKTPDVTTPLAIGTEVEDLLCGQPAPPLTNDDLSIEVDGLSVRTGASVTMPVVLEVDGEAPAWFEDDPTGSYVVAQAGVIVASSLPPAQISGTGGPAPAATRTWEATVQASATCDPTDGSAPLAPGDYKLFAVHRLPLQSATDPLPDGSATGVPSPHTWLVSAPVPLTVTPEPDPVEIRDALGWNESSSDTSVIFEALRQSASDGSPAEVDLVVEDSVPRPRWTVEPDGARTLTVEPNGQLPYRDRTTSDDGWSMTVRGGFFEPDLHPDTEGYVFTRFVGTYSVSLDDTRGVPHFELQVLEGGTPVSPPPTTDPAVCAAWNESLNASHGVYTDFNADSSSLWSSTSARSDFEGYQAIKARWIDSPMVWWAMTTRGEDVIVGVCAYWWE